MLTFARAFLSTIFEFLSLLPLSVWTCESVSQKALLSLPEEVLYEVMHHLDWKEMLAVGSTCRRLRAIRKTRLLWQYKAIELSASSGIPLLEEPIEAYTADELEQIIIRRLQTLQKWRQPPSLFHSQKISTNFGSRSIFRLLPGGRWLLDNIDGCVYVADLDAPEMTWNVIFDERQYNDYGEVVDPLGHFTIWTDPSKPWLSVRVALHNFSTDDDVDSTRICIYQLDLTGHGPSAKWAAEQIITLQTPAPCSKRQLQLEKEYVLERCLHRNPRISKVHVYQYSDVQPRSCNWEYDKPARFLLLPNDRLAMVTETVIEISNMKPAGPDGLVLEPHFRVVYDLAPILSNISPVYVKNDSSYIITANEGSVIVIRIPHDATVEPSLKSLPVANIPADSRYLQFSLMVRLRVDSSMDFITYMLDEAGGEVYSEVHVRGLPGAKYVDLVACDEASGRLILSTNNDDILLAL